MDEHEDDRYHYDGPTHRVNGRSNMGEHEAVMRAWEIILKRSATKMYAGYSHPYGGTAALITIEQPHITQEKQFNMDGSMVT